MSLLDSLLEDCRRMLVTLGIFRTQDSLPPTPQIQPVVPTESPPATPVVKGPATTYSWANPSDARHLVRVMCDEMGLTLYQKEVICACIMQESGFLNWRSPGVPMKNYNYRLKDGSIMHTVDGKPIVSSTDWGICQINDTKGWHIGPGLAFSSVDDVVQNPEKSARYMILMAKAGKFPGKLYLWTSFKSGAYMKYMPK